MDKDQEKPEECDLIVNGTDQGRTFPPELLNWRPPAGASGDPLERRMGGVPHVELDFEKFIHGMWFAAGGPNPGLIDPAVIKPFKMLDDPAGFERRLKAAFETRNEFDDSRRRFMRIYDWVDALLGETPVVTLGASLHLREGSMFPEGCDFDFIVSDNHPIMEYVPFTESPNGFYRGKKKILQDGAGNTIELLSQFAVKVGDSWLELGDQTVPMSLRIGGDLFIIAATRVSALKEFYQQKLLPKHAAKLQQIEYIEMTQKPLEKVRLYPIPN